MARAQSGISLDDRGAAAPSTSVDAATPACVARAAARRTTRGRPGIVGGRRRPRRQRRPPTTPTAKTSRDLGAARLAGLALERRHAVAVFRSGLRRRRGARWTSSLASQRGAQSSIGPRTPLLDREAARGSTRVTNPRRGSSEVSGLDARDQLSSPPSALNRVVARRSRPTPAPPSRTCAGSTTSTSSRRGHRGLSRLSTSACRPPGDGLPPGDGGGLLVSRSSNDLRRR